MEKSQMVCVKTVLDPWLLTLASLPSPPPGSSTLPQRPTKSALQPAEASLWLALCPSMRVRSQHLTQQTAAPSGGVSQAFLQALPLPAWGTHPLGSD